MEGSSKIRVAILFGGKSAEHEVSLMSARNVYRALDKGGYEVTLIGIAKSGAWCDLGADEKEVQSVCEGAPLSVVLAGSSFLISNDREKKDFDVVFPVLHGPYGEDGSVQGLLRLMDVPFVGAGVLGSALGMDKDVMKRVLRDAGLPIARFIAVRKWDAVPDFRDIQKLLSPTVFIKPANLGSSVGISRAGSPEEYREGLRSAFAHDEKVVIEEYVPGREIEVGVLGNEDPVASVPGEIVTDKSHHQFYSYEAKYIDEKGAELLIPAKLSEEATKEAQKMAIDVFQTLCCEGMARVDFFLKDDGAFVVNEINTIPGFTSISMYPRLWKASGLPYSDLLDRLIDLAIKKFERGKCSY